MATDYMEQKVGLTVVNNEDGKPIAAGCYGKEVMFDMYRCDVTKFNRRDLRKFFNRLVKLLDMKKGDLHFWDDVGVPKAERQTDPKTKGTSAVRASTKDTSKVAVQFILTSNITIHCLPLLERVYINIFSCKDFDTADARRFCQGWLGAFTVRTHVAYRL